MSKFKIINLIDKLFVTITIFLIIFAWINFYIQNLWITFVLSLIFSSACVFVLYYFLDKSQQKENIKKDSISKINDNFLYFRLLSHEKKLSLLNSILSLDYETSIINSTLTYSSVNKKHLVIIATNLEKIDQNELINLLSEYSDIKIDCIDIICSDFDTNINTKIFKDKEINLVNKTKLYNEFFKQHDLYPNSDNIDKSINKLKFIDILRAVFAPRKAKSYFFCGLILIFSSIILPYNTYYIIVGSMLLLFSIICKIYPKIHH